MRFSLFLFALAATLVASTPMITKRVVPKNATAVPYTVASNAYCLGGDVPDYLITRSQKSINSDAYVAIPGPINATDCALLVGIINEAGTMAIATLVDTTDDGTVKLSKSAWKVVAPESATTSINAVYFISNAGKC